MIQIIIQTVTKVLFWRRGAKNDSGAALSLKEQERLCREFAQQAGYSVVATFRERRGGKGPRRPEFEKLEQAARDGKVDVVYVYDCTRLSRKLRTDRRDKWCRLLRRFLAMEDIAESSEYRASREVVSKPIPEHAYAELPVAIYARDATHRPEESTLAAQVAACVKQAEEDGERVDPVYIYRERGSGRSLDRSLLGRLREAVQAGKVRAVYVYKPSCLSRRSAHLVALEATFASAGVALRCVQGAVTGIGSPRHDRSDSMGSGSPRDVNDESFTAVKLVFELSNAGWTCDNIAGALNELVFQSEDSKGWDASTLKGILEKWR